MMMGLNEFSANDAINKLNKEDIEKILKFFGDEKDAKIISKNIIKFRENKHINTEDFVNIIERSKRKKNFKVHSATKSFQALRIFVNKEISELIYGLINSVKILKKNGVLAVVTFHSLEDKIVKYFFKNLSENKSVSRYEPKVDQKELFFSMSSLFNLLIASFAENSLRPIIILGSPNELNDSPFFGSFIWVKE